MTMTERMLYQAFDFQRFTENPRLRSVIEASHARTAARELSDDELSLVAAAGSQIQTEKPEEPPK